MRNAGIKVCSGGILGLGEEVKDRAAMLVQLANLPQPPESVPIQLLAALPLIALFLILFYTARFGHNIYNLQDKRLF